MTTQIQVIYNVLPITLCFFHNSSTEKRSAICYHNTIFRKNAAQNKMVPENFPILQTSCLLHKLVFSGKIFYDLLQRVRNRFGKEIADSHALKAALIYFVKKFLLELQIAQSVSDITAEWTKKHNIKYEVDENHIFYLSLQIELLIKQFMKPVPILVLSELTAELEILSLYKAIRHYENEIFLSFVNHTNG